MERRQSTDGAPPLYRRSPVLLARDHPYHKIGRPKMALMVVGRGQKPHRNYMEDPIGETYNPLI